MEPGSGSRKRPWKSAFCLCVVGVLLASPIQGLVVRPSGAFKTLASSVGGGSRASISTRNTGGVARGSNLVMQVWSNPQAVEDYQNLLAGIVPEEKFDGPSVIVGGGKLGSSLQSLGMGNDVIVGRGGTIPETIEGLESGPLSEFPIYVCVPNDEVANVIESCPDHKRPDLCFLQGGVLEPMLKTKGLCRKDTTQATLHFIAGGRKPYETSVYLGTDGRGEAKYAGESTVCGKWADALVERLKGGGIVCNKLDYNNWRRTMYEQLVFHCAINLIGALHDFPSYQDVGKYLHAEVDDMTYQLCRSLRSTAAVTILSGYEERILALCESRAKQPTAWDKSQFKWWNGYFYNFSALASSRGFDDPCELHSEYLGLGKERGVLDFDPDDLQPSF